MLSIALFAFKNIIWLIQTVNHARQIVYLVKTLQFVQNANKIIPLKVVVVYNVHCHAKNALHLKYAVNANKNIIFLQFKVVLGMLQIHVIHVFLIVYSVQTHIIVKYVKMDFILMEQDVYHAEYIVENVTKELDNVKNAYKDL